MSFLTVGDPAPWFTVPSTSSPSYHFDTVGGYRVILFFFGSSKIDRINGVLKGFCSLQEQFELYKVPFFGVSIDPGDSYLKDLIKNASFCKFLWDFERSVSTQYGVYQLSNEGTDNQLHYTPTTFVLDENLRILRIFPLENPACHVEQVLDFVKSLPALKPQSLATRQAPVLLIPNVFDQQFCQYLTDLYEADGGRDSGFMTQVDGKTVEVLDHGFKQRRDFAVRDSRLLNQVNDLIWRRVKPEVEKAFQFSITRFERHLVPCYEAKNQGFFNRHRDNTTKGTAHRRFAMTLNLNTGSYEGGCLRFPEYGPHLYRPDIGEAIIFSCSLLHEATPVTSGRRFALLSFFYNDEDARLRQQNQKYVVLNDVPDSQRSSSGRSSSRGTSVGFQTKQNKKRR